MRVFVTVAYAIMIVVNALANALPLNGRGTGEVSDSYSNLFAPAGVSFAIWGLIYLLLGLHVLYQWGLFHKTEHKNVAVLKKIALLFSVSSLANATWIFTWHYDFIGLSTLLMFIILITLILIVEALSGLTLSKREKLFLRLPFSVYFGWITVATALNITVWLVSVEWGGFGLSETVWAVVIISVAAIIGTTVSLRNRDLAYALVFLWAYIGILIKHTTAAGFDGEYPAVIWTTVVWLVVFTVAMITVVLRRRRLHLIAEPSRLY